MKVLQVPFGYFPDPVGGTEVYVEGLARQLQRRGITMVVAAPADRPASYEHGGIPVRRYVVAEHLTLRELYGDGDPVAAQSFARLLEEERPDLVHLHAFTSAISLLGLREAARRRIPTVFTYHTPTVSCARGSLLRWGRRPCDGGLRLDLCTRCTLHGLEVPRLATELVGRVPVAVGHWLGTLSLAGGFWTAVRMRELVATRHAATRAFLREVGHVVAVCEWVRALLIHNGVPSSKVTLSRQGVNETAQPRPHRSTLTPPSQRPLRLAYLGRLHPHKGVHILIAALRADPRLQITLDLYGSVQGSQGAHYHEQLRTMAVGDARITFHPPVPPADVPARLPAYDAVVVPSQWLESGPLVVLEALAAGIPVIGSRLGGIAELVTNEVDGLLVDPPTPAAWCETLRRLCHTPSLLMQLRTGIRPVRTMTDVATDMLSLYHSLRAAGYS